MAHGKFTDLLRNGGFRAFLWTQFLGAFNDSVYQSVTALHAAQAKGGYYVPLVPAVFVLPSLLFSGWAGHLADRVSKRQVLIGVKMFEFAIMLLGLGALGADRIEGMLLVVFLMGLHAAIFSPAKYGIVPEMLDDRDLSRGNALLEMSTFVAIVLGTATGGLLLGNWQGDAWRIGVLTLAVSATGLLTALRITRVPPSGAREPFRWNPLGEIATNTRHLLNDRPLWLAVLGVAFFWFAGVVLKTGLLFFGNETLHTTSGGISLLWVCLAVGIGCGNMLAGKLSGDKVELGLVPIGSVGMGVAAFAVCAMRGSLAGAAIAVALLAIASGLFVVPQYAFMQQRAGAQEKGRTIATNNFIQSLGMVLASGLLALFHDKLHVSPVAILAGFGVLMLGVTAYSLTIVPEFFVRFVLFALTHTFFRLRIEGQTKVPFRGPALLVSNHVTPIDGILINACLERRIRFLIWKPYYEAKPVNWFLRRMGAIPVASGRRDAVAAIRAAQQALAEGHVVCIFAEGALTRTGNLLPFRRGLEKIVEGTGAPIIPVHLDRLWGSIFSYEREKFFWKQPKQVPYPVTVSFGAAMPPETPVHEVRQAVQELAAEAAQLRKSAGDTLGARFVRNARRNWKQFAMADSTGRELTYGRVLMAAHLIAGRLPDEPMIGVLLPASIGGALANIAVTLAGRVPVNLNFTAGAEAMAHAASECGLGTLITSRKFEGHVAGIPELRRVYIEDLVGGAGLVEKARAYLAARIGRGPSGVTPDSPATVIFSSGSTGVAKGVVLTHYNILANIDAIAQVFRITRDDRIAGVLPFFHSFGYTVTIWFPLVAGCGVAYHSNPTEARAVGELVAKYRATLLLSTPTFATAYVRKCAPGQFATLKHVLVGAEKLRPAVADAFREKFGLELLEGYGCTEMAPVVAVNAPGYDGEYPQPATKRGTVGQPLPGVAVRIVDPATFEPVAPEAEGLVLVKGANRMAGYLNQPERTREALRDGWYVTGDIGMLDEDGFLRITDRLSRFSKIGGEMVPHVKIEEALGDVPGVVTAVADDHRGERLVVLYAGDWPPAEVWARFPLSGLPKLWMPKRENVYRVETLPLLGSGKLDLRAMKVMAERLAGTTAVAAGSAEAGDSA
jgi:acyl-[acyl-carrier-protein]-phospholipid O-acyltransferase / long-chain-fatty-acid--[acyl-carrier-protein] ligase